MSDRLTKVLNRLARPKPKKKRKKKLVFFKRPKTKPLPSWQAVAKSESETPVGKMDFLECASVVYGAGCILQSMAQELEGQDKVDVFWVGTRMKKVGTRLLVLARPTHRSSKGRQA